MMSTSPDFDSIKHVNILGQDYWSARELMPLLGYGHKWQNFEKAIAKAIIAAQKANLPLEEVFTAVSKNPPTQGGRPSQDYFLSKRACFLIAQNGDPRKPEIAAAQNYFAFTAEVFNMNQARLEQEQRLKLRLKVAEENNNLSTTAMQSGVKSENMGLFHDAGYHGQYTMSRASLAAFWNLPEGTEILDVLGPEALSANLFRITSTDAKLKRDQVTHEDVAIETHHDVGAEVRQAIINIHKTKPEDLPRAASIRKLVEEDRRKARKQKKIQSTLDDEQETLF